MGVHTSASAVPGGEIGTLSIGRFVCELPGDATGPAGLHVPSADFEVVSASSYRTNGRIGTYLLIGDRVIMTSGLHKGERFRRVSAGFLRKLNSDGSDGELRCILLTRNNS